MPSVGPKHKVSKKLNLKNRSSERVSHNQWFRFFKILCFVWNLFIIAHVKVDFFLDSIYVSSKICKRTPMITNKVLGDKCAMIFHGFLIHSLLQNSCLIRTISIFIYNHDDVLKSLWVFSQIIIFWKFWWLKQKYSFK